MFLTGKAGAPDHHWPEQIDHLSPELDACF